MKRWPLWILFGACLVVGLAGMVWISVAILRLERLQQEAARQAQVEENVRLALWRMDSALAPLLAQETARPYFAYTAFTPAERAYTRMFAEMRYGDVMVPSPLLALESPLIRLHFQIAPDGGLTSPQVPTGTMRQIALVRYTNEERVDLASARIAELRDFAPAQLLLAALPATGEQANAPAANADALAALPNQAARSAAEFSARSQNTSQVNNYEQVTNRLLSPATPAARVREELMRPTWIAGRLLLLRRVSVNGAEYIQGCWLDWDAIQRMLLDSIRDLLPAAQLEPFTQGTSEVQSRLLASLPAQLTPGNISFAPDARIPAVRSMLFLAWGSLLLGALAVGALLWGAISLSERRAAFVSAVTHELRSPLTTVSMYAEMLQEGMVRDERKRGEYLLTLRAEADRLGHLVENVLAYSRIERGGLQGRIQTVTLRQLMDAMTGRLTQRAGRSDMTLDVRLDEQAAATAVCADASAVEQIMYNLVDNAGKYAASASDRQLQLIAKVKGRVAQLSLHDHGPGISSHDAARLFRPFSKSARDAANSAPGVGLGLALSRRLAREMKGELRLAPDSGDGAWFVLELPIAAPAR